LDIYENLVEKQKIISLNQRQYCVILNPIDPKTKRNQYGSKILRKGQDRFYLQPGESLENSTICDIFVLKENQALLLLSKSQFTDDQQILRPSGTHWLITGPRDYVPPVEVTVVEKRVSVPLDQNEGIYIRDNNTGEVRSHIGSTYLLQAHESLWEKELTKEVEALLGYKGKRDKVKVVRFNVPHNSAVQLYDYKTCKSRVVFGPELVLLGPDESFTIQSLSAGKPKKENAIQSVSLALGPDFMTDVFVVDTCDHAKLNIVLSYSWNFRVSKESSQEDQNKLFSVKDFVGVVCKSLQSRVRGAVSSSTFEDFHTNSGSRIQQAIFGKKEELLFSANNLVITSVDIQSIEVNDSQTRENLAQSVNLAIEIASKSQEATSQHVIIKNPGIYFSDCQENRPGGPRATGLPETGR
jgi:major vault protein